MALCKQLKLVYTKPIYATYRATNKWTHIASAAECLSKERGGGDSGTGNKRNK